MQEILSNVYTSGYMCFVCEIVRDELQSKKIRCEVDVFRLKSEGASAPSFAWHKEIIKLSLKQTEMPLEIELAQEPAERIRKEAEFR